MGGLDLSVSVTGNILMSRTNCGGANEKPSNSELITAMEKGENVGANDDILMTRTLCGEELKRALNSPNSWVQKRAYESIEREMAETYARTRTSRQLIEICDRTTHRIDDTNGWAARKAIETKEFTKEEVAIAAASSDFWLNCMAVKNKVALTLKPLGIPGVIAYIEKDAIMKHATYAEYEKALHTDWPKHKEEGKYAIHFLREREFKAADVKAALEAKDYCVRKIGANHMDLLDAAYLEHYIKGNDQSDPIVQNAIAELKKRI